MPILRPVYNARASSSERTITGEAHTIGERASGTVWPDELPLQESPSTVTIAGFTEITAGSPSAGEFKVDYTNGDIEFNASDDGTAITIDYKGRGSVIEAFDVEDLRKSVGPWNINNPKVAADTPDDDFDDASTLASGGKWTVVSGTSGTVDLLATPANSIYEVQEDASLIAFQAKQSTSIELRQTYTLPDGDSILAAMSMAYAEGASNAQQLGICLNSSDTQFNTGTRFQYSLKAESAGPLDIEMFDSSTTHQRTDIKLSGHRTYLRIDRSGTSYTGFYSVDGIAWQRVGSFTIVTAPTRLWLFVSATTFTNPPPVYACHWVREGTNSDIRPW